MANFRTNNLYNRLFRASTMEHDDGDDIEEKLEKGYTKLKWLLAGLSEEKAFDVLNTTVSISREQEEAVSLGLLSVILTEPHRAPKSFRDLVWVTRDGLTSVVLLLKQLVVCKWLKMLFVAQRQLLWLLRELICRGFAGVNDVAYHLLRRVGGSDTSYCNVVLVNKLLDTFIENRAWLEKYPTLLSAVVYTYMRLIEDHSSPSQVNIREKETKFVVSLLRERFADCMVIGRDLVRLLLNVTQIAEFNRLWEDILHRPKSLCPQFTGVLQLLQTCTPHRFLQGQLTPEIIQKIVFLTSKVVVGNEKSIQNSFQVQYLGNKESQSLRVDLIRFIVSVIHPTQEQLGSNIIPRWAVIGWLLTTCTSKLDMEKANLALFYDWLFFDAERDNIMNIEPAILLMYNSMKSDPRITTNLLGFLCRIIPNYCPPLSDKVRQGIYASLRLIIKKRVVPSLYELFDHSRLDKDLSVLVRETFHEFYVYDATHRLEVERLHNETGNKASRKSQIYKDLCEALERGLEAGLLTDKLGLKLQEEEDKGLLCSLVPAVYTEFPQLAVGNPHLLHLLLSIVDASQLQDLVCLVVQGELVMFRVDSLQAVLSASLAWETFEQFCLWKLVAAHGIPIDHVLPILPRLEYSKHAEALTAILLMLKQETPTAELMKAILCWEIRPQTDQFVASTLTSWQIKNMQLVAELVAGQLMASCSQPSALQNLEKLLRQLDRLRTECRQLYAMKCMQRALQLAQSTCSDAQRNHFRNLFSLLELDSEA